MVLCVVLEDQVSKLSTLSFEHWFQPRAHYPFGDLVKPNPESKYSDVHFVYLFSLDQIGF